MKRMYVILAIIIFSFQIVLAQNEQKENIDLLRDAEIVSIIVDEDEFEKHAGVNFFIGEFYRYINSLGKECVINKNISNYPNSVYFYPQFGCREYLKSSGKWVYRYSDLFFYFSNEISGNGTEKYSFFIDDFESNTTPNSLVKIFSRKMSKHVKQ